MMRERESEGPRERSLSLFYPSPSRHIQLMNYGSVQIREISYFMKEAREREKERREKGKVGSLQLFNSAVFISPGAKLLFESQLFI